MRAINIIDLLWCVLGIGPNNVPNNRTSILVRGHKQMLKRTEKARTSSIVQNDSNFSATARAELWKSSMVYAQSVWNDGVRKLPFNADDNRCCGHCYSGWAWWLTWILHGYEGAKHSSQDNHLFCMFLRGINYVQSSTLQPFVFSFRFATIHIIRVYYLVVY